MRLATAETVKGRVNRFVNLSTLPVVISRLLSVLQRENATIDDLAEVIRHDQTIAARVLSVANSPYFGYSNRIQSIEQAIFVLGFNLVKSIAMSVSIFSVLSGQYVSLKRLWAHSYFVANLSAMISSRVPLAEKRVCFLAGLLHDIGKALFFCLYRSDYLPILEKDPRSETEIETFGCDHAQVGRWFLETLSVPDELILPVYYHHRIEDRDAPREVKEVLTAVYLAEGISSFGDDAFLLDGHWSEEHIKVCETVGLTGDDLEELKAGLDGLREPAKEFFAM